MARGRPWRADEDEDNQIQQGRGLRRGSSDLEPVASDRGYPSSIQGRRRVKMAGCEEDELEDVESDDGELGDGDGELEANDQRTLLLDNGGQSCC